MEKEKAILDYMKKLDISREEAEQLWEDDQADFIGEEGEKMTQKAKKIKRYEQTAERKERKPKERKVDTEKAFILDYLKKGLALLIDGETIKTENEVKLHFTYNSSEYSVTLTKHRAKKEK